MRRSFALLALAIVAGLAAGCSPSDRETAYQARRALLLRQNQGLRELIGEAEKGSLVPADQFLVGIDEKIVGDIFRSELPLERPLGKHFRIRLEEAKVEFRDKYGVITVEGAMFRPSTPNRRTAVRIHGGLGKVEVDPKTGKLNIRIAIDDIEVLQAGILENVLGAGGKKLLAQRGRELLQDELPSLQVPVSLAQSVRIPAVQDGPVQLDSLEIPIHVAVQEVFAVKQKLWITFDAKVGDIEGGSEGLGVSVGKKKKASS